MEKFSAITEGDERVYVTHFLQDLAKVQMKPEVFFIYDILSLVIFRGVLNCKKNNLPRAFQFTEIQIIHP